jgi:dTDP-4-dehydrorhamnose 3,5-epimerase
MEWPEKMKFVKTKLPEVIVVEAEVWPDKRGHFFEAFHAQKFQGSGIPTNFVQDNFSRSVKGTLRGMHTQVKHPQGKLIRAIQGQIFDVAVDVRKSSPRFGQWVGAILSGDNLKALYIPPGFLHGFCVLSDSADVEYKCTDFYDPADEIGIRWDDPQLKIQWPISDPLLSPKDQNNRTLLEVKNKLPD